MAKRKLSHRQAKRAQALQERRCGRALERAAQQEKALEGAGLGAEQTGVVVAQYGANLVVEDSADTLYHCMARQNLGGLVCGDRVVWQSTDGGSGVVTARMPRDTVLTRPSWGGRQKALAANLNQIVIVSAPRPELSEALIDRYLVAAELTGIPALILINKIDLLDERGWDAMERCLEDFRRIGYPIQYASTQAAHGLDNPIEQLSHRTSVLVGQSGVGKSSLIHALLPDQQIRIGALSTASGLGRHTTSTATLYRLPQGGALIDSPGVRNFHLWDVDPALLIQGFREFCPYLGACRFRDCRHEQEPGCTLRAALEAGKISRRRIENYQGIRQALEDARLHQTKHRQH